MAEAILNAIEVQNLGKSYKDWRALEGITLTAASGSLYGLIGPDGAGKSSLLKAIAGVLTYDKGSLWVLGKLINSERAGEAVKDRIGFMPQGLGLNLYPELSVDENIDFFADVRLVPRESVNSRKEELLEMTRLTAFRNRRMKHLSGGMKQKLGLICALVHNPELLILDEPTTGVDPVSRRDFWTILSREVHRRGITAIVSTAYMDEASRFDRIALMHEGRVLAEGAPDTVTARMRGTVLSVSCPDQVSAVRALRHAFPQVGTLGSQIRLYSPAPELQALEQARTALADIPYSNLVVENPTLEDAFVEFLDGSRMPEPPEEHGLQMQASLQHTLAIECEELTKSYGDFVAAESVTFDVQRGEIFGLLGANGAGKTTVIKMLTGITPPTSGEGRVAGTDIRRAGNEVKRRIGYVSQSYSLYQDLTVSENILLYAGIYGLSRKRAKERARWIVEFGGLSGFEQFRSGSLPLGLRQRLAIGCALVHEPEVLFLDEPTSGVDPLGRRVIWDQLYHLAREHGVAVLVTTHYMSEAEHCDRLALMHSGRLVANSAPDQLRKELASEAGDLLQIHVEDVDHACEKLIQAGFNATPSGRSVHVFSPNPDHDRTLISALLRLPASCVTLAELTMDDVFVYRIKALEASSKEGTAVAL